MHNTYSIFRYNIMFLYMYSNYTNSVDPYTIIIISVLFGCIFYDYCTDGCILSVFNSHH
jgi:hypothetical protein